ncbi:MAG: YcxB family protein [Clostridiales bacterium]|nr:YcxB family protein [Clostridiales bacterium]
MLFSFDVTTKEKDYLDFNKFVLTKSPYGKKQNLSIKIIFGIIFIFLIICTLINDGFGLPSIIESVVYVVFYLLFIFLFPKFVMLTVKAQIKSAAKTNKPLYTPHATIEFYDGEFIERTPETTSTVKYTTIECVCVLEDNTVYMFYNKLIAYIITGNSFATAEQFVEFVEFIKTKVKNVEFFDCK